MNRRLPYLNLFGVLALAALCITQWRHDRRLNLDLDHSEKTRLEQQARLAEQSNTLKGLDADLTQFKTSLAAEAQRRSQVEVTLSAANDTNELLTFACGQLRESVTNLVDAVKLRDQRIQEGNERIEQLSADLNASIRKFNALVTNYNSVVQDLNALRSHPATNSVSP